MSITCNRSVTKHGNISSCRLRGRCGTTLVTKKKPCVAGNRRRYTNCIQVLRKEGNCSTRELSPDEIACLARDMFGPIDRSPILVPVDRSADFFMHPRPLARSGAPIDISRDIERLDALTSSLNAPRGFDLVATLIDSIARGDETMVSAKEVSDRIRQRIDAGYYSTNPGAYEEDLALLDDATKHLFSQRSASDNWERLNEINLLRSTLSRLMGSEPGLLPETPASQRGGLSQRFASYSNANTSDDESGEPIIVPIDSGSEHEFSRSSGGSRGSRISSVRSFDPENGTINLQLEDGTELHLESTNKLRPGMETQDTQTPTSRPPILDTGAFFSFANYNIYECSNSNEQFYVFKVRNWENE